jgi:hypothetical protein
MRLLALSLFCLFQERLGLEIDEEDGHEGVWIMTGRKKMRVGIQDSTTKSKEKEVSSKEEQTKLFVKYQGAVAGENFATMADLDQRIAEQQASDAESPHGSGKASDSSGGEGSDDDSDSSEFAQSSRRPAAPKSPVKKGGARFATKFAAAKRASPSKVGSADTAASSKPGVPDIAKAKSIAKRRGSSVEGVIAASEEMTAKHRKDWDVSVMWDSKIKPNMITKAVSSMNAQSLKLSAFLDSTRAMSLAAEMLTTTTSTDNVYALFKRLRADVPREPSHFDKEERSLFATFPTNLQQKIATSVTADMSKGFNAVEVMTFGVVLRTSDRDAGFTLALLSDMFDELALANLQQNIFSTWYDKLFRTMPNWDEIREVLKLLSIDFVNLETMPSDVKDQKTFNGFVRGLCYMVRLEYTVITQMAKDWSHPSTFDNLMAKKILEVERCLSVRLQSLTKQNAGVCKAGWAKLQKASVNVADVDQLRKAVAKSLADIAKISDNLGERSNEDLLAEVNRKTMRECSDCASSVKQMPVLLAETEARDLLSKMKVLNVDVKHRASTLWGEVRDHCASGWEGE